jgi:anti-sigma regulatory factor (Ser/Thr protein kinase)
MKAVLYILLALMASFPAMGTVLTSVSKANAIPLENITAPIDFAFTGTVLRANREFITFSDETDGTILFHTTAKHGLQLWDRVLAKGKMVIADTDKSRRFLSEEITVLSNGVQPAIIDVSAKEINDGSHSFKFARIRGVVSSCISDEVEPRFFWAQLKTDTGNCYVTINKKALSTVKPRDLIDAESEFVGIVMPIAGLRKSLGCHLIVHEASCIKIIKPPSLYPFTEYPLTERQNPLHRQYISGDVVAADGRRFFLRTNIGRVLVIHPTANTEIPAPGESVVVAGFPEHAPYWLCLNEALVKKTGKAAHPVGIGVKTSIRNLFNDSEGIRKFKTNTTGHRITIQGKVVAISNDEIEISDGANSIFVEIGRFRENINPFPEVGSTIEATGLCWTEFLQRTSSDIFPSFLRFKLYPYSIDDIRILELPPWWTPFKLVTLIGVLIAVLIGLGIWNFMLNRKAERRGKKLYEERIGHALAKHKVEERTHLAVELHDSISQTLTGVALHLDSGETATAKTLLASCREELRHCIWDLRSRTFEEKDMTEAIEHTIAPHLGGVKANVRFNVSRSRISESAMHAVLRIIRELVSNAIRHGGAKQIWIAGECDGGKMSFSVKDDGCGFDPENVPGPEQGHFGLLGIRERIEYFNGELKIESTPETGTKIRVSINMEEYENGN